MITTLVAVIALIGGGIGWSVTNFAPKAETERLHSIAEQHVPVGSYEQHLENEESQFVLQLKQDIREIKRLLREDPDDEYLHEELADMIDALCELRPEDRLCE